MKTMREFRAEFPGQNDKNHVLCTRISAEFCIFGATWDFELTPQTKRLLGLI